VILAELLSAGMNPRKLMRFLGTSPRKKKYVTRWAMRAFISMQ